MIRVLRLPLLLVGLLVGLLVAALLTPAVALAEPAVTVAPVAGPPTTAVTLAGSGFGVNEAVDVYAETTAVKLTVSNAAGAVTVATTVPASAQPGAFWFTLVGRRTGNAAQVAFTVRTDSPIAGFTPTRASYNRFENTITPSTAPSLQLRWSARTDVTGPVVTSGGRAFVVNFQTGRAAAFDARTGAPRWNVAAATGVYAYTPAVVAGTVVVARTDGYTVGLNPSTGATKWVAAPPGRGGNLAAAGASGTGTTAIVAFRDGAVRALNSATGATRWTATLTDKADDVAAISPVAGLVVLTGVSTITALDLTTGAVAWTASYDGQRIAPVIAANTVVTVGFDQLCAWDLSTGVPGWCTTMPSTSSRPAVANNRIFVALDNGQLATFEVTHGTPGWTAPVGVANGVPFVAGGLVWCPGVSTNYTAFSVATGQPVASVGGVQVNSAVVADGILYAGSSEAPYRLNAFSLPDDGTDAARPSVAALVSRSTSARSA